MDAIWQKVQSSIHNLIPNHSYKMWIEPIKLSHVDEDKIVLNCPNFFSKKRVQDHYLDFIETQFSKEYNKSFKLVLEISEMAVVSPSKPLKKISILDDEDNKQLVLPGVNVISSSGRMLRKNFTFDKFIVGGNNDFAYSAALALSSSNNKLKSPLLLLSETGLGKSHLAQAVGNRILSNNPCEKVYYITAEDFMNEMVNALRGGTIEQFKEAYRNNCDVLLLDDIHFLNGKDATQKELALTLDYLFDSEKKIIFSSCYLPSNIPKMNDQLKSRLSSGLISQIEPPNYQTRVKILKNKVIEQNSYFPEDVVEYLASELSDNIRQLESGIVSVLAKSSLLGSPINISLAESVLKNIVPQDKKITVDLIKKLVCSQYNITEQEIVSASRKKVLVKPRQLAIYLARKYTDHPLKVIGKSFNRYHATVIHSINTIEKEIKKRSVIFKHFEYLSEKLDLGKF